MRFLRGHGIQLKIEHMQEEVLQNDDGEAGPEDRVYSNIRAGFA